MSYSKVNINGHDYYVSYLPIESGNRKRVYGVTVEDLQKKINDYNIPTIPQTANTKDLFRYWLRYGKLSTKKHNEYSKLELSETFFLKTIDQLNDKDFAVEIDTSAEANKMSSMLHDFISWTLRNNCVKNVTPPKTKYRQDSTYYRAITTEQFLELRNTVLKDLATEQNLLSFRYKSIVLFCAFIGLRIKSISKITDLKKEGENWYLVEGTHKYLIPSFCHEIAERLEYLQKVSNSNMFFGHTSRSSISNMFEHYGKKLQINNLTPSSVRRAYGMYLIEQGVDLVRLSSLLGDSIFTVYRTYHDKLTSDTHE